MNWYRQMNKTERRTFIAAFGGWALDALDTRAVSGVALVATDSAEVREALTRLQDIFGDVKKIQPPRPGGAACRHSDSDHPD